MTHLVVVDGSNLFMRNYHGLKAQDLRTESGHPTWGTYGYFKSLSSLSQLLSPTHLVVAWDFGKSAKRHLLDPNYKMNRTSTREDDLALQLDDTQRLEVLLGIKSYGEPGVEADDIIADVVFQWEHQVDGVIIVSGDHDMEQLISDRVVVMKPPSKSGGAPSLRDLEWVQETYPGVPPPRLPEIWALQGDCQPTGTEVTVRRRRYETDHHKWGPGGCSDYYQLVGVPIEEIQVGDRVLSRTDGRNVIETVEANNSFEFSGDLVDIKTDSGRTSQYTPRHRCMATLGSLQDKPVVYLMRRGNNYRVGKSTLKDQLLAGRRVVEGADSLWVLEACESESEALLREQFISHQYNIPTLVFRDQSRQARLDEFWELVGDQTEVGDQCLRDFGRDPLLPYLDTVGQRLPSKYLGEVRAANLLPGMSVRVFSGGDTRNTCTSELEQIEVVDLTPFQGVVHGLSVSGSQMYVADHILTHNSSDDIPGVPRVGPKTALKLIQTYGNLGGVLVSQESKLDGYRDRVRLNHQLIQLTPGVSRFQKPLGWAEWPPVPPDTDKLKLTLEALEFLSLWEMYLTNTLWHKEKIGTRLNDVVHEDQ